VGWGKNSGLRETARDFKKFKPNSYKTMIFDKESHKKLPWIFYKKQTHRCNLFSLNYLGSRFLGMLAALTSFKNKSTITCMVCRIVWAICSKQQTLSLSPKKI
jgi:hypothetical protein